MALALLFACTACGDDAPRSTAEVDGRQVFVINDLGGDCDDTDACVAEWTIDGRAYDLACRPDLPGKKIALYAIAGRQVPSGHQAWTADGAEPSEALIVPQGEPCPDGAPRYLVAR